jgi:hypothetical protein
MIETLLKNYIKPFNESEVSVHTYDNINDINGLIDEHQMCINILEAIKSFHNRRKQNIDNINSFSGTFPELRRKYVNNIDTINRCIIRLEQRYMCLINK